MERQIHIGALLNGIWGEASRIVTPSEKKPQMDANGNPKARQHDSSNGPEWATGLRRLYDSVVDEPLPASFSQLLDQLDADGDAGTNG